MLAVANGNDEFGSDEHHDLAGLGDASRRLDRFMGYVVDRLEDGEERVVVPLYLGSLLRVDGIFDGDGVQPEDFSDRVHLFLVGFAKSEPHKGMEPLCVEFAHGCQRGVVAALPGSAVSLHVDGAVDDGIFDRRLRDALFFVVFNEDIERRRL